MAVSLTDCHVRDLASLRRKAGCQQSSYIVANRKRNIIEVIDVNNSISRQHCSKTKYTC